jgi:pSer/pThr/pTyr-binding forkhead associated (FHA) protein
MEVKLFVMVGEHKGRTIPLPETIVVIGRDQQCHIRPHCQAVSRMHCAIAAWTGKVRLRDLKSRNGTYLNGQRIEGEVAARDGDELRVGTMVFIFQVKATREGPRPAVLNEREMEWLLDVPAGPDAHVISERTWVWHGEPSSADPRSSKVHPAGSKALSAGQHLRTYLAMQGNGHPQG